MKTLFKNKKTLQLFSLPESQFASVIAQKDSFVQETRGRAKLGGRRWFFSKIIIISFFFCMHKILNPVLPPLQSACTAPCTKGVGAAEPLGGKASEATHPHTGWGYTRVSDLHQGGRRRVQDCRHIRVHRGDDL